ncbi:F-box/WD repeat-containing protein 9 [Denticeps clupeoides]|uniref:F-box domain-containing protein n=1 Tax=Denticeps clupeoides TaxID=299321 RepID=A0AAY4AYF3_9TELE|nr:F-box/WD repeat-containing protein 9 [Denticeps clupeoides]XP_028841948.1 F-box/WD repeat-containing protein 9 [Denticeps clupeoides]
MSQPEATGDGAGWESAASPASHDINQLDQLRLNPEPEPASPVESPSPCSDAIGLLSLPWEIVSCIASHLPAQCIINVLPQVCRALGQVGEDTGAWQMRAQRLIATKASYPVGPRENFDWPTACLEMERLISLWATMGQQNAKEMQTDGERDREAQNGGGPGMDRQNNLFDGVAEDGAMEGVDVEEGVLAPNEQGAGAGDEEQNGERIVEAAEEAPEVVGGSHVVPVPPSLERITLFPGHIADVDTVLLVGREGAVCASGSRDRNVNLWSLRPGSDSRLLQTLTARGTFSTHRGWVWCLAARDELLASGSFDSTVRLWDLGAGGAERGLIKAHAAILCMSCQADVLLTGSYDQKVRLYDIRAAEPLVQSLRLHNDAVLCLAADDHYILSGSKDHSLSVFDLRARKQLQKFKLSSYLLSMSYNGREVWAGDNHGLLRTFSAQAGIFKPLAKFNVGHTSLVTGIHHSLGTLYTCSSDRSIRVHLPSAPPRTLSTLHHTAEVNGLSVDAGVLAVASGGMSVEVWKPLE